MERVSASIYPTPTRAWLLTGAIVVLIVGWIGLIFVVGPVRFVVLAPKAKTGFEVLLALGLLFGALPLFLFPEARERDRLHWVAGGFVLLSLGGLVFGYLMSLVFPDTALNVSMYLSLLTRVLCVALCAVGLVPAVAPPFRWRWLGAAVVAQGGLGLAVLGWGSRLPALVHLKSLEAAAVNDPTTLHGLTAWHWALSLLPLGLGVAAALGAARHYPGRIMGGWLLAAMVLLAGTQLHTMFWPSAYSPILTTASLLRLAFTLVVAVGGILELNRIAAERATLLAAERVYGARLGELAMLKTDFTAMVAHELGSPIAAIRAWVEVAACDPLSPLQAQALAQIQQETEALVALVADVHAAAAAERADFALQLRPVPVAILLADAAAIVPTLPGNHPLTTDAAADGQVLADRERIGQVLRNLLTNAAKYAPKETPIELRAWAVAGGVRFEVRDHGPGIHPDDLERIFAKFGRGRGESGVGTPGLGLGLYISRRIVRAHGSDLTVTSPPGAGAAFGFDLEVMR